MTLFHPLYAMIFITLLTLLLFPVSYSRPSDTPAFAGKTWGEIGAQVRAHLSNLFETPVLFYVLLLAASQQNYQPKWFIIAAWAFVLLRVFHAAIHISFNIVKYRAKVFRFSVVVLISMLIGLITKL